MRSEERVVRKRSPREQRLRRKPPSPPFRSEQPQPRWFAGVFARPRWRGSQSALPRETSYHRSRWSLRRPATPACGGNLQAPPFRSGQPQTCWFAGVFARFRKKEYPENSRELQTTGLKRSLFLQSELWKLMASAGEDAREPVARAAFSRSEDFWKLPPQALDELGLQVNLALAGEDAREPVARAAFSRSEDFWKLPPQSAGSAGRVARAAIPRSEDFWKLPRACRNPLPLVASTTRDFRLRRKPPSPPFAASRHSPAGSRASSPASGKNKKLERFAYHLECHFLRTGLHEIIQLLMALAGEDAREPVARTAFPRSEDFWKLPPHSAGRAGIAGQFGFGGRRRPRTSCTSCLFTFRRLLEASAASAGHAGLVAQTAFPRSEDFWKLPPQALLTAFIKTTPGVVFRFLNQSRFYWIICDIV